MRRLRPVDLAREHGLSAQAVRNYEEAGILPAAERTKYGYRVYTGLHAEAMRAFVALIPGHGHATATRIMQLVNERRTDDALRLVDESHAQLLEDRRTLAAVRRALGELAPVPVEEGVTFIGPLARKLNLRPATLRKWEKAGLIAPRRDRQTGYRVYNAADVRDAQLAHQLRRGGYLLEQIAPLLSRVRQAGGLEPLEEALEEWQNRLSARGVALLAGAGALHGFLLELSSGLPGQGLPRPGVNLAGEPPTQVG